MNRSRCRIYHSDSMVTQLILSANERFNHDDPVKMNVIVKGSKTSSINWDRTPYFEFAYNIFLVPATILIWPAIIISVISFAVNPYTFNMVSCLLYASFGIISGWAVMLYNRQQESKIVDYFNTPEYSVHFDKKNLWQAGIIGGLLGLGWAVVFYWTGIWIHLHPRGG